MNISISTRVFSKTTGLTVRSKVEKKNITKTSADTILKELKTVIPSTKGTDRGQLKVRVDGKVVHTQKFKGIDASTLDVLTAGVKSKAVTSVPVKKQVLTKTAVKKPAIKK